MSPHKSWPYYIAVIHLMAKNGNFARATWQSKHIIYAVSFNVILWRGIIFFFLYLNFGTIWTCEGSKSLHGEVFYEGLVFQET